MPKRVERCDRCGRPFGDAPRKKLTVVRDLGSRKVASDYFIRYYCDECAAEAKRAVLAFEKGVTT